MPDTVRPSRIKASCEALLIAAFFTAMWLPVAGPWLGRDGVAGPAAEKRALAKRPQLDLRSIASIKAYPQAFEAYYDDHFGYRRFLMQLHQRIKRDCLQVAAPKVIFGKNGWLFYTEARILGDFMGQDPLTPQRLARWQRVLERRQAWLAEQGIRYLFVIPPNKATIYPENLPDHIQRNRGQSRLDQLVTHMRANSTVPIVDFRDDLLAAKAHDRIYFPLDTHWNARGRLIGYQRLCRELATWFPHIQAHTLDDFDVVRFDRGGDLRNMMGLAKTRTHPSDALHPRFDRQAQPEDLVLPDRAKWPRFAKNRRPRVFTNPNGRGRLLVFNDSFFNHEIMELLPEHFERAAFVFCPSDYDRLKVMIEQVKPDIVIDEWVERRLVGMPADHPEFQVDP